MNNTLAECPVKCLQHEGELQEFLEIYKELKPKKVMEIGSFFGGTLWFFIKNNPYLETLVSVDLPIPPTDDRFFEFLDSIYQWQSWFPENVDFHTFARNSRDVSLLNQISNTLSADFDMLHIDGDHSYDGVQSDFNNYKKFVKSGGIIVFHDIVGIADVARFWNEISTEFPEKSTVIYHENGFGIGILIV